MKDLMKAKRGFKKLLKKAKRMRSKRAGDGTNSYKPGVDNLIARGIPILQTASQTGVITGVREDELIFKLRTAMIEHEGGA